MIRCPPFGAAAPQEEEEDNEYESEAEEADVFDSDFNDSESSEDDGEVAVAKERRGKTLKVGPYHILGGTRHMMPLKS